MTHLDEFEQLLTANQAHQAREDLRAVLSTPEGRRFAWSILSACGVYARSFTGEPLSSAFNEGRRSVGIEILERIEAQAPGSYQTMLKESLDEAQRVEGGRQAARTLDEQNEGE